MAVAASRSAESSEVNRSTDGIYGSVQVAPETLDPNIGSIDTPGFVGWLEMTAQPLLDFWPIALNPSPDRSVVGYMNYLRRLAAEAGIDPSDDEAVRRMDRKRKKKTSNEEWVNPHDPEAEVTKMKDGTTHLAYKAEQAVDLETGAIVAMTTQAARRATANRCKKPYRRRVRW